MTKPGHELPEFDYRGYAEDTLFAQAARHEEPMDQPEPAETIGALAVKPAAQVLEELEQRRAEKAQRWQELTDKNYTPGWIQRKLDAEFPDLKSVEQQFEEEQRREAAERRHAQTLHGPKPRRSKKLRYISPRDAGPPPNVDRDVKRAQGLIE